MAESTQAGEEQNGEDNASTSNDLPFAGEEPEQPTTFLSYLASPVVTLVVGKEEQTTLSAHQALLCKSPYFQEICDRFTEGAERRIELLDDDVHAVSCFLEYLYTGEYFPRKVPGTRELEGHPSIPSVDDSGAELLKHARVYTLAEKFQIRALRSLASSKVHCVNATVKGEIVFARYAYKYTSPDDTTVRAPIASFWATRSHTLRAEAEDEFKALCLQFPQFGYDVLTRVLDDKLKKERTDKLHPATGSGRKRARHSGVGKE
ncbi:hypothetical protein CC79DRAFT_1315904 [Sarocladium strictum]